MQDYIEFAETGIKHIRTCVSVVFYMSTYVRVHVCICALDDKTVISQLR